MKSLKGRSVYHTFEGGFWGIESDSGEKFLPLNMPEQLKTHLAQIECRIVVLPDVVTRFNWGQPCRIISFETIGT